MPMELEPFQVRNRPPTSYENAMSAELEAIYGRGIHDLAGVTGALNETGIRPPGGTEWTPQTLRAELARLAEDG